MYLTTAQPLRTCRGAGRLDPDRQLSYRTSKSGRRRRLKRFLQLNLTRETLDFRVIPGPVPNRGLAPQADIELYGLRYLQRVSDDDPKPYENRGEALHLEPGLFMNVPASTNYPYDTIVRMGSELGTHAG